MDTIDQESAQAFIVKLEDYQKRRDTWVAHNFPPKDGDTPGYLSSMGIIEEYGELAHSFLKRAQKIRGTNAEHTSALHDAIGDVTVYLWGITGPNETVFSDSYFMEQLTGRFDMYSRRPIDAAVILGARDVGELCSAVVENERYYIGVGVARVIALLWVIAIAEKVDYPTIVKKTWDSVEQRDWIKYPDTGRPDSADH